MPNFFRTLLMAFMLALAALSGGGALAGVTANGKWTYDPSREGMGQPMLQIEGCNVPGGLQRITDRDEGTSAPFWCGTPPHCLREGTAYVDSCKFIPFCRRGPRHDPNGAPGANGCRDPEDLICVSSGAHPEGGYCLQTCWDGSKILFSQQCPPPPEPPCDPAVEVCGGGGGVVEYCPDGSPKPASGVCPQPQTCPDGKPVPASGVCPNQYCPDGSPMPASGVCLQPQTCPDGSPMPASGVCPQPQTCPDGKPVPASGVCPNQYCPDGSPMPANGFCQTVEYCPDGTIKSPTYGCPQTCPPGATLVGGECLTPVTCSDGSWQWYASNCPSESNTCSCQQWSGSYSEPSSKSHCLIEITYTYNQASGICSDAICPLNRQIVSSVEVCF